MHGHQLLPARARARDGELLCVFWGGGGGGLCVSVCVDACGARACAGVLAGRASSFGSYFTRPTPRPTPDQPLLRPRVYTHTHTHTHTTGRRLPRVHDHRGLCALDGAQDGRCVRRACVAVVAAARLPGKGGTLVLCIAPATNLTQNQPPQNHQPKTPNTTRARPKNKNKNKGFKGRYLAEYLAVGEAPDEIRNVCRQRSRWTKGHMQVCWWWVGAWVRG